MVEILSKIFRLWSAFSLVYSRYAEDFQRPHPMISSELECSGYLASTAGIAALKEWPEKCALLGPRWLSSRVRILLFRLFRVKFSRSQN